MVALHSTLVVLSYVSNCVHCGLVHTVQAFCTQIEYEAAL